MAAALPPWEDITEQTTLMSKMETWLMTQPNLWAPVRSAAAHFGVSVDEIEQAAQDHYWMFLHKGEAGVVYVGLDGE